MEGTPSSFFEPLGTIESFPSLTIDVPESRPILSLSNRNIEDHYEVFGMIGRFVPFFVETKASKKQCECEWKELTHFVA